MSILYDPPLPENNFFFFLRGESKEFEMSQVTEVSVDIETTGFSFRKDQIIEIGAYCIHDGVPKTFDVLIRPTTSISGRISTITGITNDMVASDGVSVQTAARLFWTWLQPLQPIVFVGHNIKIFDMPFLIKLYVDLGHYDMFRYDGILDTLTMAKTITGLRKRSLGFLYEHIFHRPLAGAHRAHVDAMACYDIYTSTWFRQRVTNVDIYKLSRKTITDIFWERYLRLARLTRFTTWCPRCQGAISPYFIHVHVI